jgi:hypothetical protein
MLFTPIDLTHVSGFLISYQGARDQDSQIQTGPDGSARNRHQSSQAAHANRPVKKLVEKSLN